MSKLLAFLDSPPDLKPGDLAPDINLLNDDGQPILLSDVLKQNTWVVLFFYPKDNTPGCTAQACAFRDSYADFKQYNAKIFGISADSDQSHDGFKNQHSLPFPLISDKNGIIAKAFGVKKTLGLLSTRVTFVIGPQRQIHLAYSSQLDPASHRSQALHVLQSQPN